MSISVNTNQCMPDRTPTPTTPSTDSSASSASTASGSTNTKRPVAKHACLACREKKIKCDGEVLSLKQQNIMRERGEASEILYTVADSGEIRHKQCTNCKNLGIQCIFVKSQRGGRKKKDTGPSQSINALNSLNSLNLGSMQTPNNVHPHDNNNHFLPLNHNNLQQNINHQSNFANFGPLSSSAPIANSSHSQHVPPALSPHFQYPAVSQPTQQPQYQQSLQQHVQPQIHPYPAKSSDYPTPTSFISNHMHRSASIPLVSNTQDSMNQIQRSDVNNRNQSSSSITTASATNDFAFATSNTNTNSPPDLYNTIQTNQNTSPSAFIPPSKLIFSNPASKLFEFGNIPKPASISSQIDSGLPLIGTTPSSTSSPPVVIAVAGESREQIPSINQFAASSEYISFSDEILSKFDLPSWKITTKLIDLYYRYIHPSRSFLPPKHRLVYELNVRNDASLLHAMFVSSCRFINVHELPSSKMKDPEHWYFLAEKYWDYLNFEKSLQALVLLMGSLGPNGYVQQSIDGCERIYKLFKLNNLLNTLDIEDFEEFKLISTKRQIINYEDLIRTVWGSWKLNVFLRINRGVPFKKISESILEFPETLPFPLSDLEFNENSKIYNDPIHNSVYLQQLQYKRFKDFNEEFFSPNNFANPGAINDETCIIIAIRLMECIMNDISTTGPLTLESIEKYNTRLDILLPSSSHQIWQFSNIKKPTYYINISKVFAICIGTVAKLSINVLQCAPILLIKPHRTDLNKHPDYVFNSLNESKIHEVEEACLGLTPHIFNYFIKTFISSFEIIKIIELGYGITHAPGSNSVDASQYAVNPNIHVVGGPSNFQPASKICSMRSESEWWVDSIDGNSVKVTDFNDFPDVWLQYPVFSVVCVGHSLTVLASSTMLTKQFQIIDDSVEMDEDRVHFEILLTDKSRLPLELNVSEFKIFKENFNLEKLSGMIKLCSKYIHSHGKYWAYIGSVSDQADGIVNYIDDLINQRS